MMSQQFENPDFERPEFNGMDEADLRLVNWLAKADHEKREFCYLVKEILLNEYSTFDGYDLQEFTRPVWMDDEFGPWGDEYYAGETYSWHEHILERRRINDAVFHRPTPHFRYQDIKNHHKQSPRFIQMLAVCRTKKIEGKQETPEFFIKGDGIRALRRLVHKFKKILRREIPKRERPKYPFLKVKRYSYSGKFDAFLVRVPSDVAVCSGCGSKLITEISDWDLLKINLGRFERIKLWRIRCDYYRDHAHDCPEAAQQFRYDFRKLGNEPGYKHEIEVVSDWARQFFTDHLEEFAEELDLHEFFAENAHEFEKEEVAAI